MKVRKGKAIVASDNELNALINTEASYALSNSTCEAWSYAMWYEEYSFVLCNIIKPLALGILNGDGLIRALDCLYECFDVYCHLTVPSELKKSEENTKAANDAYSDLCSDGKIDFMIESTLLEMGVTDKSTMDDVSKKITDGIMSLKETFVNDDIYYEDILRSILIRKENEDNNIKRKPIKEHA